MLNDVLDIGRIDLDLLRTHICKSENTEQGISNSLEEIQEHNSNVKQEEMEDEGADVLEVS